MRLLLNSNTDPEFSKKLFSLPPIQTMINSQITGLSENEREYFLRFLLFGLYEIIHTWINKEDREIAQWFAALLFQFIMRNGKAYGNAAGMIENNDCLSMKQ